jgi:hypothetical protein
VLVTERDVKTIVEQAIIEHHPAAEGADGVGAFFMPAGSRPDPDEGEAGQRGRAGSRRRTKPGSGAWRSRIVGYTEVSPFELLTNPKNWREHPVKQLRAIAGALTQIGWIQAIIVNVLTGHIVDGHARVEEAITRGEPTVPVVLVELTIEEERLAIATFDPLGTMALTDTYTLEALLGQLGKVDDAALRSALGELALRSGLRRPGHVDPDEIPAEPDPARLRVRTGDLLSLGDHLLAVGDATDPALMGRLVDALDGRPAECVWTDMPFGVGYVGKTAARLRLANDDPAGSIDVLARALGLAPVMPSARFYLVAPSDRLLPPVLATLRDLGWRVHQQLIWLKDRIVPGHSDYQPQFEAIMYGYAPGAGRPGRGRHPGSRWYGGNTASSVLAFPRPARSLDHPTQKPVALVEACLANSTRPGELVFDPFVGSGTSILACERLARRCAAVEIEPRFAQIAIERWEAYTGREAVRHD